MPFSIRPRVRRAFRLALRRRDLAEAEIDEELRFHVDSRVEQLMARGLTRDEATRSAHERFGASWPDALSRLHAAGQLREERLDMRERLDAWWHDLRYATRTLSRQRGFAFVVIATFALGIGANATMFGVIDRLLLQPPPGVGDPASVVEVGFQDENVRNGAFLSVLHYPLMTALRADTAIFSDAAAATDPEKYALGRGAAAQEITGVLTSASYFTTLHARPAIGRFFGPDDDRDVSPGVAVVSYGFWQRHFGAERSAIGKTLQIGPRFFTVIGVAPRGFTGMGSKRVDAWIPIASAEGLRFAGPQWATDWGSYWIHVVARVRPGVEHDLATAHATAAYANGQTAWRAKSERSPKAEYPRIGLRSILPSDQLRDNPETKIARLLVAVTVVVLLIACANVTNLLLARGTERRREIAVRLALGVTRRRLVRLLFAETALLAALGGAVALFVSIVGVRLLRATLLADFEPSDIVVDPRVVAVTFALVVLTSVLSGLVPAISSSGPNVTDALKAGGKEGSVRRSRVANTLIVAQAALSVLLLVGAGLFVTSLRQVGALQLGYQPRRVIAATMDLESIGYKTADQNALLLAMRERLKRLPGVVSVAASATHPLYGAWSGMWVHLPGRDSLPQATNYGPYSNVVTGDYFKALSLPIVEGRPINDQDVAADGRVVVLSEPMARAYWPGESALGRCVLLGSDSTCWNVVGVAANAREWVASNDERFVVYVPATPRRHASPKVLIVQSRDESPERLTADIRRTMQSAAPNLPFADVQSLESMFARQIRPWQMGATLFTTFGVLAVLVAALGLYSAISYRVIQRRHEFGVRMALGAHIADVIRLVMGQGVRAAAIGVSAGCLAALLAGRYIADLLFQTSPRSPVVFGAVAVIMLLVAVAATFIPAWRASRVDPATALRTD
jgi:putative ABC transport system permease protein